MDWVDSSSEVIRLGPLARRLLARRRRWLRWFAAALACVIVLMVLTQLRHHGVRHHTARPAGMDGSRAAAVRGVPSRPVRAVQTPLGVAAQVPPGMRAVNLILPAPAAFSGRLAPGTRVDLVAAFDTGDARAVRTVLASGVVLDGGAPAGQRAVAPDGRLGASPALELAVAIPAAREREIAMAQVFGRLLVMVRPVEPDRASSAETRLVPSGPRGSAGGERTSPEPLLLRQYLGLPAAPAPGALAPFIPGLQPVPGTPAPVSREVPPPLPRPSAGARPASQSAAADSWTVEIIEGTTRSVTVVPREAVR